jgi:hypothetical protein
MIENTIEKTTEKMTGFPGHPAARRHGHQREGVRCCAS